MQLDGHQVRVASIALRVLRVTESYQEFSCIAKKPRPRAFLQGRHAVQGVMCVSISCRSGARLQNLLQAEIFTLDVGHREQATKG